MARTIMVSNDIYEELKKRKGSKSFSETIRVSLYPNPKKARTLGELIDKCAGTLPSDDKEYDEVLKESRKMWDKWKKKLEREMSEEEYA